MRYWYKSYPGGIGMVTFKRKKKPKNTGELVDVTSVFRIWGEDRYVSHLGRVRNEIAEKIV